MNRSRALGVVVMTLLFFWVSVLWGISRALAETSMDIQSNGSTYIMKTTEEPDVHNLRFQLAIQSELLYGIKLGYTQRGIWRITERSAPITDMDYNPSIFYEIDDATIGYEHESNGLDGAASRSWERVYLMYVLDLGGVASWTNKIWQPFYLHENIGIPDYQGTAEVRLDIAPKEKYSARATWRIKSSKVEIWWDLGDFFVYGQSFHGFGPNIIEFDKETHFTGLGIALSK